MKPAKGWDGAGPTTRELAEAAALEQPFLAVMVDQRGQWSPEDLLAVLKIQGRARPSVRAQSARRACRNLAAQGRIREVRAGVYEVSDGENRT